MSRLASLVAAISFLSAAGVTFAWTSQPVAQAPMLAAAPATTRVAPAPARVASLAAEAPRVESAPSPAAASVSEPTIDDSSESADTMSEEEAHETQDEARYEAARTLGAEAREAMDDELARMADEFLFTSDQLDIVTRLVHHEIDGIVALQLDLTEGTDPADIQAELEEILAATDAEAVDVLDGGQFEAFLASRRG